MGDKILIKLQGLQTLSNAFVRDYNKTGYAQFVRTNTILYSLAVVMVNSNTGVIKENVQKIMCLPYFDDTSKALTERVDLFLEVYRV